MKRKIWVALGIIVLVIGFLTIGAIQMYREYSDEKVIDIKDIQEIQVNMAGSDVRLVQAETGSEARFHYYGKSLQEISLSVAAGNGTLTIGPKRKFAFLGTAENTKLDVHLPAAYRQKLSIKTSSGKVTTDALDLAGFTLNTSSGGLEAQRITAGKTSLYSSSGGLIIEELYADELEIKVTSSTVNIGECVIKGANIKTTSGSVALSYKDFRDSRITVNTTSGGISLGLPEAAQFSVDAEMTPGHFHSDFALNPVGENTATRVSGRVGTSDSAITLHASGGRIEILKNVR